MIRKALRYEILRRDGFRCRYCGATAATAELHVDHVNPEALGGQTVPENLVTACTDCNAGKGSNSPDAALVRDVSADQAEWRGFMARARVDADAAGWETEIDRFDEVWRRWRDGAGIRLPRPAAWPRTVANYLADGLEIEELLEFIDIAMRKEGLEGDIPQWRYFCGCAKRRIGKLRGSADELRKGVRALKVGESYRIGDFDVTVGVVRAEGDEWHELTCSKGGGSLTINFGQTEDGLVESFLQIASTSTYLWTDPAKSLPEEQPKLYPETAGVRLGSNVEAQVYISAVDRNVSVRELVEVYETALDDAELVAARLAASARPASSPQPQLLSDLLAGVEPASAPSGTRPARGDR